MCQFSRPTNVFTQTVLLAKMHLNLVQTRSQGYLLPALLGTRLNLVLLKDSFETLKNMIFFSFGTLGL